MMLFFPLSIVSATGTQIASSVKSLSKSFMSWAFHALTNWSATWLGEVFWEYPSDTRPTNVKTEKYTL